MIQSIVWKNRRLEIVDQTQLPGRCVFIRLSGIQDVIEAIRKLRVRGAPAIGIAAAYGLYLGIRDSSITTTSGFFKLLDKQIERLASARPTAANLRWALENARRSLWLQNHRSVFALKAQLLKYAIYLQENDRRRCLAIAEHGQSIIKKGARILTYCHTGALATGGIGTALGVFNRAHSLGKDIKIFACETRPLLQGARLTVWELSQLNIPVQLICDNAVASLMSQKMVDLILVGADCISADGGFANKIGTYGLSVLAKHHRLPMYLAAPLSTINLTIPEYKAIPIELRAEDEVRRILGKQLITLPKADCWNPAFDVTPPNLIKGIITEHGIIYPPFKKEMRRLVLDDFASDDIHGFKKFEQIC